MCGMVWRVLRSLPRSLPPIRPRSGRGGIARVCGIPVAAWPPAVVRSTPGSGGKPFAVAGRFAACVRNRRDTIRSTPSAPILPAIAAAICSFCSAPSDGLPRRSKQSVAQVLTLFTFWPPGPPLRANVNRSSRLSIETSGRIVIRMGPPALPECFSVPEGGSKKASRGETGECSFSSWPQRAVLLPSDYLSSLSSNMLRSVSA